MLLPISLKTLLAPSHCKPLHRCKLCERVGHSLSFRITTLSPTLQRSRPSSPIAQSHAVAHVAKGHATPPIPHKASSSPTLGMIRSHISRVCMSGSSIMANVFADHVHCIHEVGIAPPTHHSTQRTEVTFLAFLFVFFLSFFVFRSLVFSFLYLLVFSLFLFPIDLRLTCVCVVIGTTCNIYVVVFLGWQAV